MAGAIPRPEHPRPDWRRDHWQNLNGSWRFRFDDEDLGLAEGWAQVPAGDIDGDASPFTSEIVVPFSPQSALSGIGDTSIRDLMWYARTFTAPPLRDQERVHLNFGAVDYRADVWVNGCHVVTHEGGHTPFHADITDALRRDGLNAVIVRAQDHSRDPSLPRGKQDWFDEPSHIFYNRTSGIWQTVWLAVVDAQHVQHVHFTPDLDAGSCHVTGAVSTATATAASVSLTVHDADGTTAAVATVPVVDGRIEADLRLAAGEVRPWSPEEPHLYDVEIRLHDGDGVVRDVVRSYFGMRSIEVRDGRVLLNGAPVFQRLVLDQGYWPDGLLTAPSDASLRRDLELARELGFNGVRKHQKVEEPRWLYWADRLGVLVWGEMANAYHYTPERGDALAAEWSDVMHRDHNHPSVIVWVPLNESSGCRVLGEDNRTPAGDFVVDHALRMYQLTRRSDPSRPALSNDGWEHSTSDLLTVHDYRPAADLRRRFASAHAAVTDPGSAPAYLPGYHHDGEPVIVSEYGGIFFGQVADRFDYQGASSPEELVEGLEAVTSALLESPVVEGFCYTQLADVEHETNGLLYADRRPKAPMSRLRGIISRPRDASASPVLPEA